MNGVTASSLLRKLFQHNEYSLLTHAIPQAMLIINADGIVIFANDEVQKICLTEIAPVVPLQHYTTLIDPNKPGLLKFIAESFLKRKNLSESLVAGKQSYLIESKVVYEKNTFAGVIVTFSDIAHTLLKERQHELLYQISSALSGVSSLNQLLKVAITQIMRSMDVSAANIMLYEETTNTLSIKIDTKQSGPYQASREFRIGEGLAGKCAQDLRPHTAYDIAHDPLFTQRKPEDRGALLVVPMVSRGKLLGVINVADGESRYFTESEVQFLTIVANDIAIALENTLLYERLNDKVKLLSKLFWISSFSGVKTLDTRIQRMVKIIPELLDAEDCCIYIHSPSRNTLILKYQKDIAAQLPLQIDLKQASLSRTVFFEQEACVLNNLQRSPDPVVFKRYKKIRSLICCPIHVNQKAVGNIYVINKHTGGFDEEDKHLLTVTAHRIGTQIENAQLLRKVEAEKDLLQNIILNTSEGVAVLNRKRQIIIWNRYLEELTGLSASEVIGLPCYKILYSKLGLKKLTQGLYAPLRDNNVKTSDLLEEGMKNSRGEKIWVGSIYSHLFDSHKNVENTIIVFRNISKDKEFIEAKNEFISIATHELRTPLTAIKGYLSMILKGDSGKINTKQREYFNKAFQATERLVGLVEELLDVVRIDEERVKFNITTFPMNQVINEGIDYYREKARGKNITISFTPGSQMMVKADPDKTKQILCNLIDNAIKYTKDGGTITIYMEKNNHEAIISVNDTGVGIPAKYLRTIFDRFVRVPNSLSVKAGGTGLGLYIVKSLVEKQGGKIWATSQLGKETTFFFTLPLAKTVSSLAHETEEEL